jgi:hypothetical protein
MSRRRYDGEFAVTAVQDRRGTIYFVLSCEKEPKVKIGFATNVRNRLRNLQVASPVRLVVVATVDGHNRLERTYHEKFRRDRLYGEWFRFSAAIREEILHLRGIEE